MKAFYGDDLVQARRGLSGQRLPSDLLDLFLRWANESGMCSFTVTTRERERYARILSKNPGKPITTRAVANAMSVLSRPIEKEGVELLVKVSRERYMLNPHYYFIGSAEQRDMKLDDYAKIRKARQSETKARDLRRAVVEATERESEILPGGDSANESMNDETTRARSS